MFHAVKIASLKANTLLNSVGARLTQRRNRLIPKKKNQKEAIQNQPKKLQANTTKQFQ